MRWVDLGMMVIGGRERAAGEYEALLSAARFTAVRTIPVSPRVLLIEARPGGVTT